MMAFPIDKLKERYIKLFPEDPCDTHEIEKIEKSLGIVLPLDFRNICSFYSGGHLGYHSIFTFSSDNDGYNIVQKTLFYRKSVNLPKRYIALEETEVSFIIMETKPSLGEQTPIIYCSIPDVYNLVEGKVLEYKHRIFSSFTEFFKYLLEQEENEQIMKEVEKS